MKYIPFFIFFILFSCNKEQENNENVIAEVYKNKLHLTDIVGLKENLSAKDSSVIIKLFTEKWIKQQLLLHKAELNLTSKEQDVKALVDNYKTSLLIYKYEKKQVEKLLDTNIKKSEITDYYIKHKLEYKLQRDIVKTSYIKLPAETKNLWQIRSLYKSKKEEDKLKVKSFIEKNNGTVIESRNWLTFEEMCNEISYTTSYATSVFLRYNIFFESSDSTNVYLMHVVDYKLKNDTTPVDYLTEEISTILLNKKKIQLINELKNNVASTTNNKNVKNYLK